MRISTSPPISSKESSAFSFQWKKTFFVLFFLMSSTIAVFGSHFRYGVMTATRLSETPTTVTYQVTLSTSWNLAWNFGTTTPSHTIVRTGGNTGSFTVTGPLVLDPSGQWRNHTATATVVLNKSATPTRLSFASNAKISTISNNANQPWDVFCILNTNAPGNPPVSNMPAIINMPIGAPAATYSVPVSDPDAGTTFTFGTPSFTGNLLNSSNPVGFSINTAGLITFNTVGKSVGQQYNAMITVKDNDGNTIFLDFLINMVGPSNPPAFDYTVTPTNGTEFNVIAGQTLNFGIKATDPDINSTVSLSVAGLNSAISLANFSANPLPATGNPAVTNFSYTPNGAAIGSSTVLNFSATDNVGVQSSTSVTIKVVAEPAPVFVAPTPVLNSARQILTGVLHQDQIVASSSLGSNIRIAFATIPAGATLSPDVPTVGANPATTTLSWTPTPANWGLHNLNFQAVISNIPSIFTQHNYQIEVNTPPVFASTPPTSLTVLAGQPFTYNIVATDPDIPFGDHLDIIAATKPAWLTLTQTSPTTAVLTGTPSAADAGANNVHLELEDIYHHGNPTHVEQEFTITVIAGIAPSLVVPSNITVDAPANVCGAVVNFTATETTAVPASTITYSHQSGSLFPVGTTVVTATATNIIGTSVKTFEVIVKDITAPTIGAITHVTANATSANGANVNYVLPTATDACAGVVTVVGTPVSGSLFPIGVTEVQIIATDANGNSVPSQLNITVIGIAPSLDVPSNITVDAPANACGVVVNFTATETTAVPASTITYSHQPGSIFPVGVTTVTVTATNAVGAESKTFNIEVKDITGPTIGTITHVTANATSANGAIVNYILPTATDACAGTVTVVGIPASGSLFPIGVTEVQIIATDANGNSVPAQLFITVQPVLPSIVVPSTITVSTTLNACNGIVNFAATETTAIPASTITYSHQPGSVFPVGTTVVTATATNDFGSSTKTFNVTVVDNQAPIVLTRGVNLYLDANGQASISAAQINNGSTDNCGIASMTVSPNNFTCQDLTTGSGNGVLAYSGATANGIQNYTGVLGMDFNVVNPGGILISQLGAFDHQQNGIQGTQQGGSIRVAIFNRNTQSIVPGLDVFIAGSSDPLVNNHRMRSITPVNLPVGNYSVVALGYNNAELNGNAGFPGYPATNKNTNGGAIVFTGGARAGSTTFGFPTSLDTGPESRYHAGTFAFSSGNQPKTVVLSVTDIHGNTGTATAQVTVLDNIAPSIVCASNITVTATSGAGAVVNYTQPTATDNCSATVTRVAGLVSGSTFPLGVTTVTYSAKDASGNESLCSFTVTVTGIAPSIVVPPTITVASPANACGAVVNFIATETTGIPASTITYSHAPGSNFMLGTTLVTATATNAVGTSVSTFELIVKDLTPPVFPSFIANVTTLATSANGAVVNYIIPAASDNCAEVINATATPVSGSVFPIGTTTVTVTATDAAGNTATSSFTVTVVGIPPVIVVPANITVNNDAANCGAVVNFTATETTAIPASTITYSHAPGSVFSVGTTTVTATATNAVGSSTGTFTVTVDDTEKPVVITRPVSVTLVNGAASVTAAQVNNGSTDNCGIQSVVLTGKTNYTCADLGTHTVTLTVTDIHGNVQTATAVVTVNGQLPSSSIVSQPTSSVYTGGNANNIYLGYGAQSTVLKVNATGGSAYTYQWIGAATNMLSSTSSGMPVFTPTVAGTYTFTVVVTNNFGCPTTSKITICVKDIRVPGSKGAGKVYLCHMPPGNNQNPQTLEISVNAVDAHLRGHSGDRLGSCATAACVESAPTVIGTTATSFSKAEEVVADDLKVVVMPNPTSTYFTLKLVSKSDLPVNIKVVDAAGRLVEGKAKQAANSTLQLGHNYATGNYFAEFIQGNQRKVVQLMKIK